MIALRRDDVTDLNHRARAKLLAACRLTGPAVVTADGLELQAGDRIVCLRNDRRLGAVNGTRATITGTDPTRRAVEAIDDRGVRLLLPAGYLDAGHVTHGFATYARHAGSPHIGGPHGLRHSLASALDASGNGLATISPRLGHASTAVTSKVYTHMLKGADRAAVDVHAARILPGLVKADPEPR